MFVARDLTAHLSCVVGTGHCVPYVREAAGAPHTALWRRGERARDSVLPVGTAIATFDADGRYRNATDGTSHAALFLWQTPDGLVVLDQWLGQPVHQRTIRFKGGKGLPVDDGDQYHVVVIDAPTATAA
jgi:hypothetical protein